MTASDQLGKLAARTKEAEDPATAARGEAEAELEQDVQSARASAQARAEDLRRTADTHEGRISEWWDDVEKKWHEHVATIREDADSERAEHWPGSSRRLMLAIAIATLSAVAVWAIALHSGGQPVGHAAAKDTSVLRSLTPRARRYVTGIASLSPERLRGAFVSSASAGVTTCGPDTLLMAVPPVLSDLG